MLDKNRPTTFRGYRRPDGTVGVRNYVAVISTVWCANTVTGDIAARVRGAVPITHSQGCPGVPIDLEMVSRTLIGLGTNPNVYAVVFVGLGCESVGTKQILEMVEQSGRPVEFVCVQDSGGTVQATARGIAAAARFAQFASELNREECSIAELVVGTKCGSSDSTSGPSANRVVGFVADRIIEVGGAFIIGEICDLLGTENILADRAVSPEIAKKIFTAVGDYIERGRSLGLDIVGSNVTYGNKKGGITTLVEKSLGAVSKCGTAKVTNVLDYGDRVSEHGLYIIKGPARSLELLTGQAAAGAQLNLWTTGRGTPGGNPLLPVIKITGNANTWNNQETNMDFDASGIIAGTVSVEEYGKDLFAEMVRVASGKLTKSEILKCDQLMDIEGYGHLI